MTTTDTATQNECSSRRGPRHYRSVRLVLAALVLMLVAAACGTTATTGLSSATEDELSERAGKALEPAEAPTVAAEPVPATENPAPSAALNTEQPTEVAPAEPTPTPPPIATSATEPTPAPAPAPTAATTASVAPPSGYDGVLPAWFSIPNGFVPTDANMQTGSIDVLTIAGTLTAPFDAVCADFVAQAAAAALPPFGGSCETSSIVYGTESAKATAQSFSRTTAELIFIGFELVQGGAGNAPAPAVTAPPGAATPPAASGIWPDWYRPPVEVEVINWRDTSSNERRITTNLNGLDYVTVCNDWRAQAAAVGLVPTTSKQCDDPIISWTVVESSTGADAEIQDVADSLDYDVLFVFDTAAMLLGRGDNSDATAPAQATPAPATTDTDGASDGSDGVLPPWFNPTVTGTELAHAVEDGVYEVAAIGEIGPTQTFTELCAEFERQATAAGWVRQSGDACGEDIFDGATFIDPVTGFEGKVRNYRGSEIVYAFEVAADLTPAEITAITFDPELALVPAGFSLVPGEQVIGLAESIDDTGAYNTALHVSGGAVFADRCERLTAEATGAVVVLGGCDSPLGIVTLSVGSGTTIILEGDVYTFVTR